MIYFRNDGDDNFTDVTLEAGIDAAYGSGLGVVAADFNNDGYPDIYVANDLRANQLWINQGNGTFKDLSLMSGTAFNANGIAEAGMGVTAADFDHDGDEDLYMTHLIRETNTLYLNDGRGNFHDATNQFKLAQPSVPNTGFGTRWFDYDNDGDLDIFIANGAVNIEESQKHTPYPYRQKNQLLENIGNGEYRDISAIAGAAMQLYEVSRGAAFGDIDNDGDIDIVISNNNGPVRLLRNEVGNQKHWLQVKVQGTESNRDGIGARVAIIRNNKLIWNRVHTDGSYLSTNDIRVHFGLGDDPTIDGVVIHWPNGSKEIWKDIQVDRLIKLVEGTGEPWNGQL